MRPDAKGVRTRSNLSKSVQPSPVEGSTLAFAFLGADAPSREPGLIKAFLLLPVFQGARWLSGGPDGRFEHAPDGRASRTSSAHHRGGANREPEAAAMDRGRAPAHSRRADAARYHQRRIAAGHTYPLTATRRVGGAATGRIANTTTGRSFFLPAGVRHLQAHARFIPEHSAYGCRDRLTAFAPARILQLIT
jgi:hypothetical protein